MKHVHYSHHGRRAHHISLLQRINLTFFIPLVLVIITVSISVGFQNINLLHRFSLNYLLEALGYSFGRLFVSYVLALIIGIFLALWALRSKQSERVLLPIYDILESVPILVFFPVIIVFFLKFQFFNGAAIFIIFLNMLWNIVFNVVGALHIMPQELYSLSKVLALSKFQQFSKIILPSIFPALVTGSLLAWAEGWNMLIVAEVLHTYIPHGQNIQDLFGIGSVLVNASASGNNILFVSAIVVIIASIALLNLFIWQSLLRYSSKFKFD